ncbi:MAG: hypothetical protein GF308_01070 [Candidatus Heimdallarchaeota archaeon]|nr:hypothetical protein [Candidatus Heimdallarchaeota archaeon]
MPKQSNNILIFLRHAETALEKGRAVSKWLLSTKGKEQAKTIAQQAFFQTVDKIYSSPEQKAYQTALPLATAINKKIHKREGLNELNRDKGGYLKSKEAYQQKVKECFTNPCSSINNWEKASDALERFEQAINLIDRRDHNKRILIVSHGLVSSLYFAKLVQQLDQVYERWLSTSFCGYGIVQNDTIIKDIARTF